MSKSRNWAGLLFAAFVLIWVKADDLMAHAERLAAAIAQVLSAVPTSFWLLIGAAVLLGTGIVTGAFFLRLNRQERSPAPPRQ